MSSTDFLNVVLYGTYFNPAKAHYNNRNVIVSCDRCKRQNLSLCIGWKDLDLCFQCTNEVNNINRTQQIKPDYVPTQIATYMMQDLFGNHTAFAMEEGFQTRMEQEQFRPQSKDTISYYGPVDSVD